MKATRAERSKEQKDADNDKDSTRMKSKRAERPKEQKEADNEKDVTRKKGTRAERSKEQQDADNAKKATRQKAARAERTLALEEATQKNRANFELEKLNCDTNFANFEDHPETSVLLYHLNSGHEKFRSIEQVLSQEGDREEISEEDSR